MKHVPRSQLSIYLMIMAVVFVFASLSSCSEEDDTGTGPGGDLNSQLRVEGIILNPKSPARGDTLFATAIVTSDTTAPGDFASYSWSADGGSFVETNLSTVRWVAPDTSAMYSLMVVVSNSSSTRADTQNVFVNDITQVVSSDAGEMRMSSTGDSLYFYSSPVAPTSQFFNGFGASVYRQSGTTVLMPPSTSIQTKLSDDFSMIAYASPLFLPGGRYAIRVHYRDLVGGGETIIPYTPFFQRGPQYLEPSFSPDNSLLTYQVWFPDVLEAPPLGIDTFVVAIWDVATETEKRVAVGGTTPTSFGLNFHPVFSNDGAHLVYMSDPGGSGDYELYALPVVGGTVPVDTLTTPTQLTFSSGDMGGGVPPAGQPRRWSPVEPILATRDGNLKLRIVPVDGSGDILVNTPGTVTEFTWSPDGQNLLVTNGSTIYKVSKAGTVDPVHQAPSGDNVSRLSWSSDGKMILFAIRRLNRSWYEVVDVSGTLGFTGALKVTDGVADGEAGTYANFGSIAPVWDPAEATTYMLFFNTGDTPSISKMSFGGLLP